MSFFSFVRKHSVSFVLSVLSAGIAFLLFADVSSSTPGLVLNERIVPYVLCTEGKTIVKTDAKTSGATVLSAQERTNIAVWNVIRTQAYSSATVFWPDGSITRLGEASTITIRSLESGANGKTNVDFSLEWGKSWTNLARYLDPDSHFTERFDNDTKVAAVRGTVFEINLTDDYVRTVDHAIELSDAKSGQSVGHLAAGSVVRASKLSETLGLDAVNKAWDTLNSEADKLLLKERFDALKERFDTYSKNIPEIKKWQDSAREKLGMASDSVPFQMQFASGTVRVSVDPGRLKNLSEKQVAELQNAYEAVSGLANTQDSIASKETLRNSLERVLPEPTLRKFRESFARASLYESWDAGTLDLPVLSQSLRTDIARYLKDGTGAEELMKIEKAIPKERVDAMNARVEAWKKRGFEIASETDWAKSVLQVDEASIMENIGKFNDAIDSLTGK